VFHRRKTKIICTAQLNYQRGTNPYSRRWMDSRKFGNHRRYILKQIQRFTRWLPWANK